MTKYVDEAALPCAAEEGHSTPIVLYNIMRF